MSKVLNPAYEKVKGKGQRTNYVIKTINAVLERLHSCIDVYAEKGKLTKRHINKLDYCIRILETTKMQVEKELAPKKPKTINDSIAWITSQKKDGTFIALMTKDVELIKTMYITKNVLKKIPKWEVQVTPIELKMNKIELVIEELGFRKAVPKKTYAIVGIRKYADKVEVIKT